MKKFKPIKILSLFLITVLISSILFSCGDNVSDGSDGIDVNNPTDSNTSESQSGGESDPVGENAEPVRLEPDLPDADFGGYTFTFIAPNRLGDLDWVSPTPLELVAEEETGEPVNDAVYRRNMRIMERYNVEFNMITSGSEKGNLNKAVKAGDDLYGAVVMFNNNIPGIVTSNLLLEISELPYIDLNKPWWDSAVSSMSVANKNFLLGGDLLILDNEATNALVFNKKLMSDLSIELPYNAVKNGTWTLDMLTEKVKGAGADLNGDGMMGAEDRWGLCVYGDTFHAFLIGGGGALAVKDENDIPYLDFTSQKNLAIIDKALDLMFSKDYVVNVQSNNFYGLNQHITSFQENKILFMWIRMRVVEQLRGMDSDFGILPIPKYDEVQEKYYSVVNPYTGALLGIPKTVRDVKRTSIILEALAAESRYTVQPAYYDVVLTRKYARDEESEEMLDIIFNSRVYDVGAVYAFGDVFLTFKDLSTTKQRPDVISFYESKRDKIQSAIDKFVETLKSMD